MAQMGDNNTENISDCMLNILPPIYSQLGLIILLSPSAIEKLCNLF